MKKLLQLMMMIMITENMCASTHMDFMIDDDANKQNIANPITSKNFTIYNHGALQYCIIVVESSADHENMNFSIINPGKRIDFILNSSCQYLIINASPSTTSTTSTNPSAEGFYLSLNNMAELLAQMKIKQNMKSNQDMWRSYDDEIFASNSITLNTTTPTPTPIPKPKSTVVK